MIDRALARAAERAQAAEISVSSRHSVTAEYEDDRLKNVAVAQTTDLGARVIVNGKLGAAHGTDPARADDVVSRAIELAEFGSDANFQFPAPNDHPAVNTFDPAVESIPKEDLVASGAEIRDLIKAYNHDIKAFAYVGWEAIDRRIVNSSGLDVSDRSTTCEIFGGGMLIRGTDMLNVYHGRSWRRPPAPPREIAEQAVEQFRLAERTASVSPKSMPVILAPRASTLLLLPLQLGYNGKNVLKGDSPLAGRLGDKIASEAFSLTDDATMDYAPRSAPFDGEGVARRRIPIIENGRLNAFLYDLETAGNAGVRSTGSGPGCGPSNLIISPGSVSFADMIAGTKEGILVHHVMGLGQSNIINGDFSVNVSLGYKIENGEIVGRVKDVMLAGNIYDALDRIEAIGSQPEWFMASHAPPIKLASLSVVAKS